MAMGFGVSPELVMASLKKIENKLIEIQRERESLYNTMNAYKTAVEERYRFFSFGDSSFFC